MSDAWRAFRRRVLTPGPEQTRLGRRGFHLKDEASRGLLETVGAEFVAGFGYAAGARTPAEAEARLEAVPREFRGFAYEGAAMALTIMDGLSIRGRRMASFLAGEAERHIYMAHVGVGWALARLPRWRWRAVMPTDPLLGWLVLDGYGFHQAYFHPDRYVRQQRPATPSWPADPIGAHAAQVVDQGIGRALWFVAGADVGYLARTIEGFPLYRRADLYCGAALAATYAGGAREDELWALREYGAEHRPVMAQGSAFAAKARVRAGLVTAHTGLATSVFCGLEPEEAAAVTDAALIDLPDDGEVPAYQAWRRRIADQLVSLGRC